MKSNKKQPSIFEVFEQFNTEERCISHFERIRWPHGLRCIRCDSERVMQLTLTGKPARCVICTNVLTAAISTA